MKHHFLHYMDQVIQNRWNEVAFADYGEKKQYTHGEVAQQVERFHKLFRLMGIKEGDKIAIASRNCSNWVVSYMAILSYKAVAVTLLQDFKADDLARLIKHSDAKMLFVGPFVWRELQHQELPELDAILSMDDFSFIHLAEPYKGNVEHVMTEDSALTENTFFSLVKDGTIDLDSMALINYTSGSTGNPKGVMLTHLNLSGNVDFAINRLPHQKGDKVLSMLPIAHMFGLMFEFLYQVCDGAEVYFLTKAPTPTTLMKAFAQVHPFMILTVPLVIEKIIKGKVLPIINKPLMKVLWKTPGIKSLLHKKVSSSLLQAFGGSLRFLIIGGAALNEEVETCMKEMHFMYCVGYGMTECAPLISYEYWKNYVYRSCGKAISGMQIRIDSEDPQHKEGEVQVYGVNVMKGYYKNEQATREAFTEDGWMRTGDLGILDKDGNLFLRGRSKNMLLSPNGQNIYPEEIEDKLNSLPLVTESVVVDREHKLVALVYSDPSLAKPEVLQGKTVEQVMKENVVKLNKMLPNYSQVIAIELVEKEFEKTPKRSIKRFMYK
mgnify:CR=1 FL=1